jgi:hypothetical protein
MKVDEAQSESAAKISVTHPAVETGRVIEVDFRRDPRWLDFLASHPDATIYHHPGWLASLESEYGRKCKALGCEASDGRLEAVLPLLYTRGFPLRVSRHSIGRRLSSLPRTPLAGPLAKNAVAMKTILNAAIELVQREPHLQLEIKTAIPDLDEVVPALQRVTWRDTFVRGLPHKEVPQSESKTQETRTERPCSNCDECKIFRFGAAKEHHQIKWATNKARREGIAVRLVENERDLREWYPLYLQAMRRNVVPPRSLRFFLSLWRELGPTGQMALVLAEHHNSPPGVVIDPHRGVGAPECNPTFPSLVSGSILLQFSQTAFWAFTGSTSEGLKSHANDLVLWQCLHDSCRRGYNWCDLGEVAENHPELIQFKAKWGTMLRPMYRYYYPTVPHVHERKAGFGSTAMIRVASSIWRQLPLRIVAALGDWVFSFL